MLQLVTRILKYSISCMIYIAHLSFHMELIYVDSLIQDCTMIIHEISY